MRDRALVELTVRYGEYGQQQKTIALPISEDLTRELMEGVELSDEPFSLILASPAVFGGHEDAVTLRKRTFKMRKEIAQAIANAMVPELLKAFGVNDELEGAEGCKCLSIRQTSGSALCADICPRPQRR
jgi:hypothetical protein